MADRIHWGILGTGNIAQQFAVGVNASAHGVLAAVGSRTDQTASQFAQAYSVPAAYGGYEPLLADGRVDAVYIALPNSLHEQWTIRALQAGKHVLCEKPLAANAEQAGRMFDAADRAGRVLMEAFMYRCHPLTHAVEAALARGAIGELRLIRTSFCYRTTRVAENVRFRRDLAGGGLMDIGCYCIDFSRHFAGAEPVKIHAVGHLHPSGVDDLAAAAMLFPGGITASFTCGMTVQADNTAYLCGSEGYIKIPVPWKPPPRRARYTIARGKPPRMDLREISARTPLVPPPPPRENFVVDAGMDLYGIEADDFATAVLSGRPPRLGRQNSIGNLRVLDEMRRQLGVEA